jgi:hypothetical protein
MTGEEKLAEFLKAVDDWIDCKNIIPQKGPTKKIKSEEHRGNISKILSLTRDDIKILTGEECLAYAYELHSYGEYLESVKAKEDVVLEWADSSIWYIISTVMQNYGTQYTKWQEKYYSAVKENPLAAEILKVKKHAEARVKLLSGKADRIQSMAHILNNLSKRR